jgi:murein DD-endopeptidase MepM/ murein hydrolase activator NlpD
MEVRPYRFYGGLFVRQRLSSEPDRYRGRRRVPTPPRSRYAVVGAAAFVGAGVVALGAGNSFPDAKSLSPTVLADLQRADATADDIANRSTESERANRSDRGADVTTKADEADAQADAWLLPLDDFDFTSGYGVRFGKLHSGIDLAAKEGTPYQSIHSGTVTQAGYYGAYGYAVTVQNSDGIEIIYAHSRRVMVKVGDQVQAGQVLGQVGNTGASYGTHLHVEIHKDGKPTDPIPLLRDRGVDIKLKIESVYGNLAAS